VRSAGGDRIDERIRLEDEANDGSTLADGEELGLFDGKLLGWDVGLRLGLGDEASDRSPLADGAALGFVHGELLCSAVGLRLGLEDETNDISPLVEGENLDSLMKNCLVWLLD